MSIAYACKIIADRKQSLNLTKQRFKKYRIFYLALTLPIEVSFRNLKKNICINTLELE